jgi:transposase InsO family protein
MLKRCPASDEQRRAWIQKNLDSIGDGKFYYRNRDGSIGSPINFDFTEKFYDSVADEIKYYSRLGRTKVHWNTGLSDFGEKGVDCDFIMQVMDDLHYQEVEAFVEHYNHQRYHESLKNVTPADAYFGRAEPIIKQRERIKRKTIDHRRLQYRTQAA